MNRRELASFIENEGGTFAALEYGISVEDIDFEDAELRKVWGKLHQEYVVLHAEMQEVDALLVDVWDSDLEDKDW